MCMGYEGADYMEKFQPGDWGMEKRKNDLNKKHEVWKSAKLSQTCSIKQTYIDVYFK